MTSIMSSQQTILEIKNEYTNLLISTLEQEMYVGFKSVYNEATNTKYDLENVEYRGDIPNIYILFQYFLGSIKNWTNEIIQQELTRIKEVTHTKNTFDNLIKVVVKSHIIFLTQSRNSSNYQNFYNTMDSGKFLHQCYLSCARKFYKNPALFGENNSQNEQEILNVIADGIYDSIKQFLPLELVLNDYLNSDQIVGTVGVETIQIPSVSVTAGCPMDNLPLATATVIKN